MYNASDVDQGIEGIIWAILWNGTNISGNILALGGGYYRISLEPITVLSGERSVSVQ